jgi:cellulose synthase/poly-beta-1,6-N-acetylglucosamine synthase-like glycosyltransferase/peptidoglycan/xylan/chitin deacetylase (PgdA/CDA1 family)
LLFSLVIVVMILALFVQGYARRQIGHSSTAAKGRIVGLDSAGPVLDLSGSVVRSAPLPRKEVALTFDDGPDPVWTPRLLAVLRRHHVPATFFVVGSQVVAHPGLVRTELRQGNELGSHTFTHIELGAVPQWRANFELALTETALAGVVGRTTTLLRMPYSSLPSAMTVSDYRAARNAAKFGYLIVSTTKDSQDWRRPGVGAIVASAIPSDDEGAIIQLHDGGGNRSQTIAATEQIIAQLSANGYSFRTVSALVGVSGRQRTKVGEGAHLQGMGLLWTFRLSFAMTRLIGWLLIPIGVLSLLRAIVILSLARRHARTARDGRSLPGNLAPVSVLVPAFNEEVGIEGTIRSVLMSTHPTVEIIVIDDGSTDRTAAVVESMGEPSVKLIRQANAGKSAALNAGIAAAHHDLVVMMDGDTQFEPATITALVSQFDDPAVGAISGNTKVGNRKRVLGRWQHIEYVMGFNLDRRMYDLLRCMPTVPGAIGAFRKTAVADAGGLSSDTLAEDTDLTMAIQRAGWKIVYEERALAWTEAPASLTALWQQRYRWSYGTMQAMWKHRRALREGTPLGRIGLPYLFFFQIVLPLLAPLIDLFALYGVIFLNAGPVLLYWLAFNLLTLGLAVYAFRADREPLRPLWALPLQQFVYRQLMYAVVIQSVVSAMVGARLRWHKLERVGLPLQP